VREKVRLTLRISSRPTLKNVGLFASLRSIFRGLTALAQSQTLTGRLIEKMIEAKKEK